MRATLSDATHARMLLIGGLLAMAEMAVSSVLFVTLGLTSPVVRATGLVDLLVIVLLLAAKPSQSEQSGVLPKRIRDLRRLRSLFLTVCLLLFLGKLYATVVLYQQRHEIENGSSPFARDIHPVRVFRGT